MTKVEKQILAVGLANLKLAAINNAKIESIQNMVRNYIYTERKHREEIKMLDKDLQKLKERTASDLPQVFEILISNDFDLSNLKF